MTPTVEALARADNIIQQCRHTPLSGGLSTPGEQGACINCIASAFTPLPEALVQAQAFRCLGARCDHDKVMDCQETFALALTEQARDFPICTEHQRECTFCGTCLSESDSVVILKAEVKKLQDSMIRHFQREHLEGEGPEIDRWKRKLTEQMREREKERTEMLAIADRIRLELDGQAREIERLKAEKAACPGCATQTLTKGRLPHSCDAARATWEAAVKIADDEINNAPDDKSGKYADGYVRGAGAVCNKLSERARDAAQDCPGINATHHDRHLRCEQCDSAQGGKNG